MSHILSLRESTLPAKIEFEVSADVSTYPSAIGNEGSSNNGSSSSSPSCNFSRADEYKALDNPSAQASAVNNGSSQQRLSEKLAHFHFAMYGDHNMDINAVLGYNVVSTTTEGCTSTASMADHPNNQLRGEGFGNEYKSCSMYSQTDSYDEYENRVSEESCELNDDNWVYSQGGNALYGTRESGFETSPSDVRSVMTSSTSPRQLINSLSMQENTMHKLKIEQKIRQKTPIRGHPQPEYHSNLPTMLRGSTREVLSHHMRTGSKPSNSLKIERLVHKDPVHISSRWNTVAEGVSGWHGVSSEYSRIDASESQFTASGFSASSGLGLTIIAPPPSLSKSTGHGSGHIIGAAMYGVQGSSSKSVQKAVSSILSPKKQKY